MLLLDVLPRTKQKASVMLVFPAPFGPVTQVNPLGKGTDVLRLKDLKPCITIFSNLSILYLCVFTLLFMPPCFPAFSENNMLWLLNI